MHKMTILQYLLLYLCVFFILCSIYTSYSHVIRNNIYLFGGVLHPITPSPITQSINPIFGVVLHPNTPSPITQCIDPNLGLP